ncbi:MAG: hypothetical protein QOG53_2081 [Frankiales bacterium]|nr:hypothetical protein [Frankiales bacterium]
MRFITGTDNEGENPRRWCQQVPQSTIKSNKRISARRALHAIDGDVRDHRDGCRCVWSPLERQVPATRSRQQRGRATRKRVETVAD